MLFFFFRDVTWKRCFRAFLRVRSGILCTMLLKSNHTDALMDLKNNAHLTKYYLRADCVQGACARY